MKRGIEIPSSVQRYENNPYYKDMGISFLRNESTVIADDGVLIKKVRVVKDNRRFVKIITSRIDRWEKIYYDLDLKSSRVLMYVMTNLKKDNDFIDIDPIQAVRTTKIHKVSILNDALLKLCEVGFLAPSNDPTRFWINVSFFYNGRRDDLMLDSEGNPIRPSQLKQEPNKVFKDKDAITRRDSADIESMFLSKKADTADYVAEIHDSLWRYKGIDIKAKEVYDDDLMTDVTIYECEYGEGTDMDEMINLINRR